MPIGFGPRKLGVLLALLGLGLVAVAMWGLAEDVGWLAQPFYAYVWWGYILVLDGLVARRRGGSLLTTRARVMPLVVVGSVSFWFYFELLNLRFQNWYYVGVFAAPTRLDLVWIGLFGVACFATVFTGLFETYLALAALGLFRRLRWRPRRFPGWVSYAVQGLGALMVVLALGFPFHLAPLVWGSLTFLLDPWNYRRGSRSLLRDLELGDAAIVARLLAAGLACGLVWESLNYLAPQKWIYTVRGFEELKLFEMPLVGFLGFPALALDAFAAFAAASYWLHGNVTWEDPADLPPDAAPPRPRRRALFWRLLPLHVALWASVVVFGQYRSVGSIELELTHLETLPLGAERKLAAHGAYRPRQLLSLLERPGEAERVRAELELEDDAFRALVDETRLLTHKGIGAHHGRLLRRLGITTLEQLAATDPQALYRPLARLRGERSFPALRPEMVRVWVLSARRKVDRNKP